MNRILIVTAAACLIAAPLGMAQPTSPPASSTTTSQSTTVTTPATPGAPPSTTTSQSTTSTMPTPAGGSQTTTITTSTTTPLVGCRTRKAAGEPCACRSAPTRIGTSTADPASGHNICVRPT